MEWTLSIIIELRAAGGSLFQENVTSEREPLVPQSSKVLWLHFANFIITLHCKGKKSALK